MELLLSYLFYASLWLSLFCIGIVLTDVVIWWKKIEPQTPHRYAEPWLRYGGGDN